MEQGSEGTYWIIQAKWQNDQWSYDDIEIPERGDLLLIHNQWGLLEWAGIIDPVHPGYRTEMHGSVHWVQNNVDPEQWSNYFSGYSSYRPNLPYFIGTLYKNAQAVERKKRALEARAAQAQTGN